MFKSWWLCVHAHPRPCTCLPTLVSKIGEDGHCHTAPCFSSPPGTFPPWQHLLPGRQLTDDDAAMDNEILALAAAKKLERVACYRQLQGLSHQLFQLSGITIDSFDVPADACVRATTADEVRVTANDGQRCISYLYNNVSGQRTRVLPDNFDKAKLLVLMLDQGSIGTSGCAFAMYELGKLIYPKFDKIHRLIRDLKNAEKHCMGSIFMVAKMWSAYLYGINNKPFNSGGNFTQKKRFLDLFSITHDTSSDVFRKYLPAIAREWNLPYDTQEDLDIIFERVLGMRSFTHKGSQPKQANWFAWNSAAHAQIPEFWSAKMVLESQLDDIDPDVDAFASSNPDKNFIKLLKEGGGLRLAYKLMTRSMQENVKILSIAENPSWDWYTDQIKTVKTPADAFSYSLSLAGGKWKQQKHVWDTIRSCLYSQQNLKTLEVGSGQSEQATKLFQISIYICKFRMWSLSKHDTPPEVYTGIASRDPLLRDWASNAMREHYQNLIMLEAARHTNANAESLWADMAGIARCKAIRLLFELFSRDNFSPTSCSGLHFLKGFLWTIADNKSCEDVHNTLRLDANSNTTKKINKNRLQHLIINSEVFDKRSVPHRPRVRKSEFIAQFKQKKFKALASKYRSSKHKLPLSWSKVLCKKTWPTLSEDTTNRATAAWAWLHKFVSMRQAGFQVDVGSARFSKLAKELLVLQVGDFVCMSLGNYSWGFLAWPLGKHTVNGEPYFTFSNEPVSWQHITDPSDWFVIPTIEFNMPGIGVVLLQSGQADSLMSFALLNTANTLNFDDLLQCARISNPDEHINQAAVSAKDLCDILGKTVNPADPETPQKIYKCFTTPVDEDAGLDNVLVEAVYEDLDPEDKGEFPEVGQAIKNKKIKQRCAEHNKARKRKLAGLAAGAANKKKKPNPKAKAKAKPAPAPPAEPPADAPPAPPGPVPEPAPPPVPVPEPDAQPAAPPAPPAPPVPEAPPAPPVPAGPQGPAHHGGHGPPVFPGLMWTTVSCNVCGADCGQYQRHESPGGRDQPSWKLRVIDPGTGTWGKKSPFFRVLVITDTRTEAWVYEWIQDNKACCR